MTTNTIIFEKDSNPFETMSDYVLLNKKRSFVVTLVTGRTFVVCECEGDLAAYVLLYKKGFKTGIASRSFSGSLKYYNQDGESEVLSMKILNADSEAVMPTYRVTEFLKAYEE